MASNDSISKPVKVNCRCQQNQLQMKIDTAVRELMQEFLPNNDQLNTLMQKFLREVDRGLSKNTHETSDVKCFNSFVQDLPDGTEEGQFLALDLGGTNFRILLIQLINNEYSQASKIYSIPQNLLNEPGEFLFDHIAKCLEDFVSVHELNYKTLPLGFTFSFPLKQIGLAKGILLRWTKGFSCPNVVNHDIVELFKAALSRYDKVKVHVAAIVNDTVGTLMACAYQHHNCRIGVIIGTGSNACYVEKTSKLEENDKLDLTKKNIIINTEWGAFGENGSLDYLRSQYDRCLDANSINPGQQIYEKMISGMYIGELVRLIIYNFAKKRLLFNGHVSEKLGTTNSISAQDISDIESDEPKKYENVRRVLTYLRINKRASEADCDNILYICQCISTRSSHLASAGIAALLNRISEAEVTVGVDGSVYRLHPHYARIMNEKIAELVDDHIKFKVVMSEDGSSKGAALIAASIFGKR